MAAYTNASPLAHNLSAADDLCKPGGKKCKKDKQCCSGKCGEDHKCTACTANDGDCASSSECCSGICEGICVSCLSEGNPCTTDTKCCGVCKAGSCLDACVPEATTCDLTTGSGCPSLCTCRSEVDSGQGLCSSFLTTTSCTKSCDCPQGQFCTTEGTCAQACI